MSNKNETNKDEENNQNYYCRILGALAFSVGVTYLLSFETPFPQGVLGKSSNQYLEYTE